MTGAASQQLPDWAEVDAAEYRRLDLRAHHYLADVPIHDVWRVFLPAQGRPCTMTDVREAMQAAMDGGRVNAATRFLFALRTFLGRALRWDREVADPGPSVWRQRLAEADVEASLVAPGTKDGPFSVLYVHERESASEVRNATVQAFIVFAIEDVAGGHAVTMAIHVLPVSRWTKAYMALIGPFRRWIVYPSLLGQIRRHWTSCEPASNETRRPF